MKEIRYYMSVRIIQYSVAFSFKDTHPNKRSRLILCVHEIVCMNDTNNVFELGSPRVTRGAIPNDTRRTACVSSNDPSGSIAIISPKTHTNSYALAPPKYKYRRLPQELAP